MAYFLLFLIVLVNCIILLFTSALAAGGDGSSDGVKMVWIVGYPWIFAVAIAAFILCKRGSVSSGLTLAASTLPIAWLLLMAFLIIGTVLGFQVG